MLLKASVYLFNGRGEKRKYVNHEYNMKYMSIMNYYTNRSSQCKMFLEIDFPKK